MIPSQLVSLPSHTDVLIEFPQWVAPILLTAEVLHGKDEGCTKSYSLIIDVCSRWPDISIHCTSNVFLGCCDCYEFFDPALLTGLPELYQPRYI